MGKGNQSFKMAIQLYLEKKAKEDSLFAASYEKKNKSIDECCDYIIGEAKKRGGNVVAISDEEVFGMAVHYYDEDSIKVSKQSNAKVAVSKQTEKKKELASKVEKPKLKQVVSNNHKRKKKESSSLQLILFDEL